MNGIGFPLPSWAIPLRLERLHIWVKERGSTGTKGIAQRSEIIDSGYRDEWFVPIEKEAELEMQKSYTEEYFRDKELDVQKSAVEAINPSVKTIITDGSGEGYAGLVGIKGILEVIE